jgi:hypothetical protein
VFVQGAANPEIIVDWGHVDPTRAEHLATLITTAIGHRDNSGGARGR